MSIEMPLSHNQNMLSNTIAVGTLYVIAAPSGAGKTSLTRALVNTMADIQISISHTTRPQRPGEINGEHYWFVTQPQFDQMVHTAAFFEHAEVFGHSYGTSKQWVEERLAAGIDVILEIDWQGAQQVRALFPQLVGIFILPPSIDLLKQRLEKRQQDPSTVIEQRLAKASEEVSHYIDFDYIVVNDQFDAALQDLQAIVQTHRLQRKKQVTKFAKLLAELLQKR